MTAANASRIQPAARLRDHGAAPARRALPALLAAALLWGCAPHQGIYSLDPVDRAGHALDWGAASALTLESGVRVPLTPGSGLRLSDGLLSSPLEDALPAQPQASWRVTDVEGVELRRAQGKSERVAVLTPDDLMAAEDEPRAVRVRLTDGTELALDSDERGLALVLGGTAVDVTPLHGDVRRVSLDQLALVEVAHSSLLGSTLTSPAAWIAVAGAAALLAVIVNAQDAEHDAVK